MREVTHEPEAEQVLVSEYVAHEALKAVTEALDADRPYGWLSETARAALALAKAELTRMFPDVPTNDRDVLPF